MTEHDAMTAPLEWYDKCQQDVCLLILDAMESGKRPMFLQGQIQGIISNHDPGPAQIAALEARLAEAVGLLARSQNFVYDHTALYDDVTVFLAANTKEVKDGTDN